MQNTIDTNEMTLSDEGYLINEAGYRFIDLVNSPELLTSTVHDMVFSVTNTLSLSDEQREDLEQEVILALLSTYQGRYIVPVAPMKQTAARVCRKVLGGTGLSSATRQALGVVSEEIEVRESDLGRALTDAEKEKIAEAVRDSWYDQDRKPSANFWRDYCQKKSTASLYVKGEDGDEIVREGVSPWSPSNQVMAADEGSATAEAMDLMNKGRVTEAKAMLWRVLAESRGVPRGLEAAYDVATGRECRRILAEYPGGVLGAVSRWESGLSEDIGTVALFAPLGDIDEAGRNAVCALIREVVEQYDPSHSQGVAERLWESAMKAAVRTHA